jgi:sorbitol-specific phosphotransferase system component IIC
MRLVVWQLIVESVLYIVAGVAYILLMGWVVDLVYYIMDRYNGT